MTQRIKTNFEEFTTKGFVDPDKLPDEFKFMLFPGMLLTPTEMRLHAESMWEYVNWLGKDPYGKVTLWEGTKAGYAMGPQDGSVRESSLARIEMRPESAKYYAQPYVTWLYESAMRDAWRWTEQHEAEIEKAQRRAVRERQTYEEKLEILRSIKTPAGYVQLKKLNPSTTIVDTNTAKLLFSYETLVALYMYQHRMFYISITDRDGRDYGNTTKTAMNAFLGGKWRDLVKNGHALIKPQTELEAML